MNISLSSLLVLFIILVINLAGMTEGLRRVRHKSREHCQLIPDSGSCTATLRRWYYDSEANDCKTFIWGGCDGNSNRFRSRRQCERRCQGRDSTSDDDRMSTYFRAVSNSGRRCPRLRCGEHGSSCPAGTSPVFSTDDAGCPICTCRELTAFLQPSTTCPPLDCSHLVCVGPVRFSSRLVGHCPVCECVPVDDEAAQSPGPVTAPSCPELDCHFRCHGGRKRDPQTGCEICECTDDDCADCAAACSSSEPTRCAAVCDCELVNRGPCRPLPVDCELRVGCVLSMDVDGCEVCQCAVAEISPTLPPFVPACPQITCSLTCAGTGFAIDDNGCRVCACASEETESTAATMTTIAVTETPCAAVDCASQCPEEFDVVIGDNGCDACVCTKPETVTDSEDDVIKPPSNDCSGDANCKSCNCSSEKADRQNDDDDVNARCEPVTQDNCDVNCVVDTDDAGCQFCLCNDRVPDPQTEVEATDDPTMTEVKMTTSVDEADDATRKNAEDACEQQFVCHPICQTVTDDRGCVVECRCDDGIGSLADMQQQQQQQPDVVSRLACSTSVDVCSCHVDEEELWTVSVEGCPTCACVTAEPRTSSTAEMTTTTTTVSTTTSTLQPEVTTSSTVATSSKIDVECRQLSDSDCTGVTCGDGGYAKDENGCDTCSCVNEQEPAKTVHHVVATARKGACSLSPLRGPCRATITRWYYDVTSDTCETFSYGGCRGNANNFQSPESCWRYCRPVIDEKQRRSRMWYLRVLRLLR